MRPAAGLGPQLGVILEVVAGRERLVAGAGDDGDPQLRVGCELVEDVRQLLIGHRVQRIVDLGPVDGDDQQVAFGLGLAVLAHCGFLHRRFEYADARCGYTVPRRRYVPSRCRVRTGRSDRNKWRGEAMQLSDQVALVTGAGQGIGKASALALAAAGANVVAVDIDGGSAKDTAAAVAATGPRGLSIQADMGAVK